MTVHVIFFSLQVIKNIQIDKRYYGGFSKDANNKIYIKQPAESDNQYKRICFSWMTHSASLLTSWTLQTTIQKYNIIENYDTKNTISYLTSVFTNSPLCFNPTHYMSQMKLYNRETEKYTSTAVTGRTLTPSDPSSSRLRRMWRDGERCRRNVRFDTLSLPDTHSFNEEIAEREQMR